MRTRIRNALEHLAGLCFVIAGVVGLLAATGADSAAPGPARPHVERTMYAVTPFPPDGPLRILLLGSSTTGCTGPTNPDTECYVNIVKATRANDVVTSLGRGGTYVGYGTPAQNWTSTEIPAGNDIVFIQLGINDWYVPVDTITYRAQLDASLHRVAVANPVAWSAGQIHWIRTWMPVPTGNAANRKAVWYDHGVATAEAVQAVNGQFHDMAGDPAYRAADATGWHYNSGGHQELARLVLDQIALVRAAR